MVHESNCSDSQKEVGQLLSGKAFPEEGKRVLRVMNRRIKDLTRENLNLKRENTELQALNTSLLELMKTVESRLDQWRGTCMKNA